MVEDSQIDPTDKYCSQFCEDYGINCIGSARSPEDEGHQFGGYILIKDSSYWDARIEEGRGILGQIGRLLAEYDLKTGIVWRLQAIQEFDSYSLDVDDRLAIIYRNSAENGQGYDLQREVYQLPNHDPLEMIEELLRSPLSDYQQVSTFDKDLLICTHTERDRCCSRFGYPIYRELKTLDETHGYHIWRSSHIGGHRMAPTLIDLPSARYWGYMTPEVTRDVLRGDVSEEKIRYHYRGLAGLPPFSQVVEREGLILFKSEWHSGTVTTQIAEKPGYWIVSCKVGEVEVSMNISRDIEVHDLGETRCARLKPIKEFKLFE